MEWIFFLQVIDDPICYANISASAVPERLKLDITEVLYLAVHHYRATKNCLSSRGASHAFGGVTHPGVVLIHFFCIT